MPIPSMAFIGEFLLSRSEYDTDKRLDPFRAGGVRSDMPYFNFYCDFCTPGKPAFIEADHPDLSDIIDVIKTTGGIPVLAHPGGTLNTPEEQLLPILNRGVEGIEAFSNYHTPDILQYYVKKAEEYSVFVTCGSDFHGKNKPAIELGGISCDGFEQQILKRFSL